MMVRFPPSSPSLAFTPTPTRQTIADMPKASPETLNADPRIARAILSAPYPLASIRTRSYIVFRPVHAPGDNGGTGHGGQQLMRPVGFVSNVPYPGSSPLPLSGQGIHSGPVPPLGGWRIPIAVPRQQPQLPPQTDAQRAAAQQLQEALRPPPPAFGSDAPPRGGEAAEGALHVAHEIGKILPRNSASSGPKGPPQGLNLLTSTFQTILPRSLLEFRQMHEALITPPKLTSSTTFYTGVTAGGGETARPSPTTPIAPTRPSTAVSAKVGGRRYGQKGRESDSEESNSGWSSDATITKRKYRSPLTPRLETPSTPKPLPSRTSHLQDHQHPIPPHHLSKGKSRATNPAHPSPQLFLGQTNRSPFTYDLSRRRRRSGSDSTMSMLGFESDGDMTGTTVVRVPRSFAKRRHGSGGTFFRDVQGTGKGKGRMGRVEEEQFERARQLQQQRRSLAPAPEAPTFIAPPSHSATPYQPMPAHHPPPPQAYHPFQRQVSPERSYSPQPISIDPQSAALPIPSSGWPHAPQPAAAVPSPGHIGLLEATNLPWQPQHPVPHHRSRPPFTKACHNFLYAKHRQTARRRKLLLDYHRRARDEAEAEHDDEAMQVDTPAVPSFADHRPVSMAPRQHVGYAGTAQQYQLPAGSQAAQAYQYLPSQTAQANLSAAEPHQVSIRSVASIARVRSDDDQKPARKRRREMSPESVYQPFVSQYVSPSYCAPGPQLQQQLPTIPPTYTNSPVVCNPPTAQSNFPTGVRSHSLPSQPLAGPSGSGPATSTSLLPSIEIRTPSPAHQPPRHRHNRHHRASAEISSTGIVRIPAGAYGHFEFERGRAEEMDRRLMEGVKVARRDAWLDEVGRGDGRGKDGRHFLLRRSSWKAEP